MKKAKNNDLYDFLQCKNKNISDILVVWMRFDIRSEGILVKQIQIVKDTVCFGENMER